MSFPHPDHESVNQTAPDNFKVNFQTSKGNFTVDVQRDWAPRGADRFYNLVTNGYFDDVRFFRVIAGFMVQFGIHGDPDVNGNWREARIDDDPVRKSNTRGMVSFATAGPNTRTTQMFINFGDNSGLDGQGFAPFGQVSEGIEIVDQLHADYGEGAPHGRGPSQGKLQSQGNAYLKSDFSNLDFVEKASVVE